MRPEAPAIPLSSWADEQLKALARSLQTPALGRLTGDVLLRMRARLNGYAIPGKVSAGGGCRLWATRDGWIALNLARPDDRGLMNALVGSADLNPADDAALARHFNMLGSAELVAQGRLLGLAIASVDEGPASPAVQLVAHGLPCRSAQDHAPLVVDLSALWAGPLAARLLRLGGARVVKVESRSRPDALRYGDPHLHAFLNQGKERIALDLADGDMRAALIALIRSADVVIEAARPRALLQLGIDAQALVNEVPGLVWLTITGHGIDGDAANWVGFGDDAGVSGGLSAALRDASGAIGFVGDAIADPMTGIIAARVAAEQLTQGAGGRFAISMSGVIARALAEMRMTDSEALNASLRAWAAAEGQRF